VVENCLNALAKLAPEMTPIVVDNGSKDRTVERVRARTDVRLIANDDNRGFAAAVNQGIRSSDADFLLLLNPDVNLLTGVHGLVGASRQYGLAAGKLVDAQGRAQAGFTIRRFPTAPSLIFELFGINRLWPSNPVNRRYRYLDRNPDEGGPVEQPAGAFLMARRDVWERLGGMDEAFHPIWFEDVDFCRRAVDAGYGIQYVPAVTANHAGGHSINQLEAGCRALCWCVSLLRYARKHFRPVGYRAVCLAVVLSSVPRMAAGMILERSFTLVTVYSKIARIAGRYLVCSRSRGVGKDTVS
jgi:N-acetylglucosaminyl-diphospho-decaprenol L-rhamnosyltransferase